MSLLGFQAKNHPQQTRMRGSAEARRLSDNRIPPPRPPDEAAFSALTS
jgi:hypothetical protein